MGFVSLTLGWWGVTNTVQVADQLTYIASGGLFGLFLLGIAAIAYWGEQREREVSHLIEMQLYLSAIAQALGLTEASESEVEESEQYPAMPEQRPARVARPTRSTNGSGSGSRHPARTPPR